MRRMRQWLAAACAAAALWAQGQEAPTATLRVTCRPAATLWVNHRQNRTGESFTLEVPANAPTLLRLSAPGYATQWRTVTPGPGERRHEPFELAREPIPVLFRSERPATVLCDGAELGVTPFHCFFEEPRAYRVVVRAQGFQDQAIRLDLSNGKPRVVDATLTPDSGALEVTSEPAGARVQVNGVAHGVTPCTLERLREGKHTLRLTLEGHKPLTHTLELRAGERLPLRFALERLPAGLTVSTIPEGARIYVDGVFRGESDLTVGDLPEGTHTVRAELPGYATASREVRLAAGATQVEEIRLEIVRGTLAVQTQPGVVEVWEGGRRLLTTQPQKKDGFTSAEARLPLPPGPHTLTLKARGYADATRTVTIAADKTTALKVRLDFKPNFEVRTKLGTYQGVIVRADLDGIENELLYSPHMYQEYIRGSAGRDVRAIVIGGRCIGAMLRTSDGKDFRSNIAAGGRGEKYGIGSDGARLAERAALAVGAEYAGVDLLFGDDGFIVCEVNSNAFFGGFESAVGINVAGEYARYVTDAVKRGL